jgi:hypothetical protein
MRVEAASTIQGPAVLAPAKLFRRPLGTEHVPGRLLDGPIVPTLLKLAAPTVIVLVVQTLVSVTETYARVVEIAMREEGCRMMLVPNRVEVRKGRADPFRPDQRNRSSASNRRRTLQGGWTLLLTAGRIRINLAEDRKAGCRLPGKRAELANSCGSSAMPPAAGCL